MAYRVTEPVEVLRQWRNPVILDEPCFDRVGGMLNLEQDAGEIAGRELLP